jgi:uncharacterized membrane-anchored protein
MRKYKRVLLIVVVVLQAAAMAAIGLQREAVLQSGDVVYMRTLPVDPRDLFRGDYVRLGYEAASVPKSRVNADEFEEMRKPERTVYLAYRTDSRNVMIPERLYLTAPEDKKFIRGFTIRNWHSKSIGVRYGVEKFFVQQGAGWPLQTGQRLEGVRIPLEMEVAVGRKSGIAVLKGFRYADMGMSMVFPRRTSPQERPPYRITIRVVNATDEPLTIVDPPDHRTFRIELDASRLPSHMSGLVFKQPLSASGPYQQSDIRIIMPKSVYEFEIDLSLPHYQLLRGETEISWGEMDYRETARIVYQAPEPQQLGNLDVTDRLWTGHLTSQKFSGRNIWY